MILRIVETNGIKEEIPHFSLVILEEVDYWRVDKAYTVLSKSYNGINDFISILEMIADGRFNVTEVVIAGLLLNDALEGRYYNDAVHGCRAKYLKINNYGYMYFVETGEFTIDLEEGLFFEDDETVHKIHPNIKR